MSYDNANRLTDVVYVSSLVDNLHYERDPVGNILSVTHPNEPGSLRDVSYTYDKLTICPCWTSSMELLKENCK
jgi:hypothetical protein